eukprot:1349676-Rhodomonas_salina.7
MEVDVRAGGEACQSDETDHLDAHTACVSTTSAMQMRPFAVLPCLARYARCPYCDGCTARTGREGGAV